MIYTNLGTMLITFLAVGLLTFSGGLTLIVTAPGGKPIQAVGLIIFVIGFLLLNSGLRALGEYLEIRWRKYRY